MDLEDAAKELNRNPVAEPAPLVRLIDRAQSRRRSRRAATAFGALTAVVALLTVVISADGRTTDEQLSTTASTPLSATSTPPPPRVDPPATFVAHLRQVGNEPGNIVVMGSQSGGVLQTLGSAYDPYVGNGFHASADAVYWQHLDVPAQKFPVTEARLSDGATREVTEGSLNLPSPDGARLLVRHSFGEGASPPLQPGGNAYAVIGLRDSDRHEMPDPGLDGQEFVSASWLPDGRTVIALSRDVPPIRSCPLACPSTTLRPARPARAWSIDTTSPSESWRPLPESASWADVEILGPGRLPNTVAAVKLINGTKAGRTNAIITISSKGQLIDRLPDAVYGVLAVDHTGTNFLVQQDGELSRTSLTEPTTIRLGPAVAQATWW